MNSTCRPAVCSHSNPFGHCADGWSHQVSDLVTGKVGEFGPRALALRVQLGVGVCFNLPRVCSSLGCEAAVELTVMVQPRKWLFFAMPSQQLHTSACILVLIRRGVDKSFRRSGSLVHTTDLLLGSNLMHGLPISGLNGPVGAALLHRAGALAPELTAQDLTMVVRCSPQ